MSTLSDEIKEFIVKGLACFDSPSQVAEAVRVTFGIEINRQQVFSYDPGGSRPPAERWSALHAATRAKFLRDRAEVGVSHKVVRLRMLDRMAHECERDNVALTLACLREAAKECGGLYEKRRASLSTKVVRVSGADLAEGDQPLPSPTQEADAAKREARDGASAGDNEKAPGLAVWGFKEPRRLQPERVSNLVSA
jgi:hypothetical protein